MSRHPYLDVFVIRLQQQAYTRFSTPQQNQSSKICFLYAGMSETIEQQRQPVWAAHPENPFNWPVAKKWRIFLAICLVIIFVGLNNTSTATPGVIIAEEFNVDTKNSSLDNTVWLITAWNCGAAIGPMIGLPFLEAFGARKGLVRASFRCIIDCLLHNIPTGFF